MALLAVGSIAFDGVKTPFGEVDRAVGGSATYFSLSASYFTHVAVVGIVGEDFTDEHFRLFHDKGIDTRQVQRVPGKSFYWKGEYNQNLNEAHTLVTELNVFADFRPEIHPEYRSCPFLFLGNIDPELQSHVLDEMVRPRIVGLDTMNFWIGGKLKELRAVLPKVDILLINEGEARMLSGEFNLIRAARAIRAMGPSTLIIKRGEYGAMAFHEEDLFLAPAFPLEAVADPTGAGDTFAGGFMGYLSSRGELNSTTIRQAVLYGSTMASFNVEAFSVNRLKELTLPEIQERVELLESMIRP